MCGAVPSQQGCGPCSNKVCIHETWINSGLRFVLVTVIPRGQRDGGPFVFLLQLHFAMQFGCVAARTALDTKETVLGLCGWDHPRRDESPAQSSARAPGAAWGSPGAQPAARGLMPPRGMVQG